jgi:hypothetical protein
LGSDHFAYQYSGQYRYLNKKFCKNRRPLNYGGMRYALKSSKIGDKKEEIISVQVLLNQSV